MRQSQSLIPLTLVCFLLGILVVVQMRSTSRAATLVAPGSADQTQVMASLVERNAALRSEIAELEAQLARLGPPGSLASREAVAAELARLWVINGNVEVSGPGVQVVVAGQINVLDLQDLVNEVRNAGAEAIALNGQRISLRSVVTSQGDQVILEGTRLTPPYVLDALGNADTIEKALLRRGGLVGLLEYTYPGLKITVLRHSILSLPPYRGQQGFTFAQPGP